MIDLLRGYPPAIAWFESLNDDDAPGLVGFVVMELIRGCRNRREIEALRSRLNSFAVFWPSQADLDAALSDLWEHRLSHDLKIMDALIGRCAQGNGAVLCTFNEKDFSLLAGLSLERPYARKSN
jgi:predicted nucleic acid-binding protein